MGDVTEEDIIDNRLHARQALLGIIAQRPDLKVRVNGAARPLAEAMTQPEFVENLIKIGQFAMGAQSALPFRLRRPDGQMAEMPYVPVTMYCLMLDYALDACPRTPDGVLLMKGARTGLKRDVARIEASFGPILADTQLCRDIAAACRKGEVEMTRRMIEAPSDTFGNIFDTPDANGRP